MPTYEYRCPGGHEFEKFFRSISAAVGEHPCPACGAIGVRQLSGGAGLMFKGSGFYLTDYGKNAHARKGPTATSGVEGASAGETAAPAGESKAGDTDRRTSRAESAPKADAPSSSAASGGDAGRTSSATPKPKTNE